MSFFNWLIGRDKSAEKLVDGAVGLVNSATRGIDNLKYTDQERASDEKEMSKHDDSVMLELERENTKRWVSDNSAPIASLTRPFLVIYLTITVTIMAILDSANASFQVSEPWVILLGGGWTTALGGYFTLRTIEKRNNRKYLK